MDKFIYDKNNFRYTGASHTCDIKQTGFAYDVIVRGIIIKKPKIVYIRLNDFSIYQGIEYKKVIYQFKNNLRTCQNYIRNNFRGYKIFDSLSINKLPDRVQKDILNT